MMRPPARPPARSSWTRAALTRTTNRATRKCIRKFWRARNTPRLFSRHSRCAAHSIRIKRPSWKCPARFAMHGQDHDLTMTDSRSTSLSDAVAVRHAFHHTLHKMGHEGSPARFCCTRATQWIWKFTRPRRSRWTSPRINPLSRRFQDRRKSGVFSANSARLSPRPLR